MFERRPYVAVPVTHMEYFKLLIAAFLSDLNAKDRRTGKEWDSKSKTLSSKLQQDSYDFNRMLCVKRMNASFIKRSLAHQRVLCYGTGRTLKLANGVKATSG